MNDTRLHYLMTKQKRPSHWRCLHYAPLWRTNNQYKSKLSTKQATIFVSSDSFTWKIIRVIIIHLYIPTKMSFFIFPSFTLTFLFWPSPQFTPLSLSLYPISFLPSSLPLLSAFFLPSSPSPSPPSSLPGLFLRHPTSCSSLPRTLILSNRIRFLLAFFPSCVWPSRL